MEQYLSLLQWLLPSGGIGMLLAWLTSRSIRRSRAEQAQHDAYRTMYGELRETLIQLNNDNQHLYVEVAHLKRALLRVQTCTYSRSCPVRRELRKPTHGGADLRELLREHEPSSEGGREHITPPSGHDTSDAVDEPP